MPLSTAEIMRIRLPLFPTPYTMTRRRHTPGNSRPFLIGIGDTAGPTLIPGIPAVFVGGTIDIVSGTTDASGIWSTTFTAPNVPSAIGMFMFSQVLTLDATFANFVTSNAYVNLFTQTP